MTCKDCISFEACSFRNSLPIFYGESDSDDIYDTMETACKAFKDKSKFIELPCSVGDIVYYPYAGKILEKKVTAYHRIYDARSGVQGIDWWYELDNDESETMDADLIGKTVFLTRDEAEKKLETIKK